MPQQNNKKPVYRRLRGYAFDPSLSLNIDTALVNKMTYTIPWEDMQNPGPVGEYIEVIDYDPTVDKYYTPVNLDDKYLLAEDGLAPNEANPQFHQQMVYAVAMTTITNFEKALGRKVQWAPHVTNKTIVENGQTKNISLYEFVEKLRIYPHALRDANAYYSPQKKALLFGYFTARPADDTLQMPGSLVFSCLSHDIIAHETTHAILDGIYDRYTESTNPDVLAFHEAFADIVALFQHFTFPEVLKSQIRKTRGDLGAQNLLGQLAQQFGQAIGGYGALRDAIGEVDKEGKWKPRQPSGDEYQKVSEPHARGAILVAAVFEAFINIYKNRVADLLRIATGGTGVLPQGEIHPDLVNRLASAAAKTAKHVLTMCIRALDFCPPVDISFGDYLRAIITADMDLMPEDERGYRLAFIDTFRRRGIYPAGIKTLSVESLAYPLQPKNQLGQHLRPLYDFLRDFKNKIIYAVSRREIYNTTRDYVRGVYPDDTAKSSATTIEGLHKRLSQQENPAYFEWITGLAFAAGWKEIGVRSASGYGKPSPRFNVQGFKVASRVGPDGTQCNEIIINLVQKAYIKIKQEESGQQRVAKDSSTADKPGDMTFLGGCTLVIDLDTLHLKYVINKPLINPTAEPGGQATIHTKRALAQYNYQEKGMTKTDFAAYFTSEAHAIEEPFCFLHQH